MHITLEGDQIGMVSAHANALPESEDFVYYDHTIGITFKFNPIDLTSEIISRDPLELPTSDLRDQLCVEMEAYIKKAYRTPKCKYNIHLKDADPNHMIIEISCINVSLQNFWAGEWQNTYVVKNG